MKDARRIFCLTPKSATDRIHSIPTKSDIAPEVAAAREVRKTESSPRLTPDDAVDLLAVNPAPNTVLIDIRDTADYQRSHVTGSVSVPCVGPGGDHHIWPTG